jgi:hypothetical protein
MRNVGTVTRETCLTGSVCVVIRCNSYNATADEDGKPLPEGYIGGLRCCGDGNQCAVQEGYNGERRTFHLRVYTRHPFAMFLHGRFLL